MLALPHSLPGGGGWGGVVEVAQAVEAPVSNGVVEVGVQSVARRWNSFPGRPEVAVILVEQVVEKTLQQERFLASASEAREHPDPHVGRQLPLVAHPHQVVIPGPHVLPSKSPLVTTMVRDLPSTHWIAPFLASKIRWSRTPLVDLMPNARPISRKVGA